MTGNYNTSMIMVSRTRTGVPGMFPRMWVCPINTTTVVSILWYSYSYCSCQGSIWSIAAFASLASHTAGVLCVHGKRSKAVYMPALQVTPSPIGDNPPNDLHAHDKQTRTHAENMSEAAARASAPATLPNLIGGGAGLAGQTSTDLDRAIGILKGYLTEERMTRMQDVLDQRTGSSTMVFENPANPNNVSL